MILRICTAAAIGACLSAPGLAAAEAAGTPNDGVYGRFDGDLNLSLSAGAAIGRGSPSGTVIARALYLETAGIYVSYTDAFGSSSGAPPRSLALGIALRPLFIPRWSLDLERGPAIVDLAIDAITFDFAALWPSDARGHLSERPGIEVALGTGVPLLGRASGPWLGLRGALRWRGSELAGSEPNQSPISPVLFITFGWHAIINAHLTDAGDRLLR